MHAQGVPETAIDVYLNSCKVDDETYLHPGENADRYYYPLLYTKFYGRGKCFFPRMAPQNMGSLPQRHS
jgi:hypothetical protein